MRRIGLLLCATFSMAPAQNLLAVSSNVVISQVYGGGGNPGAVFTSDFVELFNRGASAVNLAGWTIQYASGASWQTVELTGSIGAGRYYLIKLADGTGTALNLPPPDASGAVNLSVAAGKLALVASTAALSGGCPLSSTVDLVGYGSADCSEGNAVAPALTNATALLRGGSGCTDTDNNAADFSAGLPSPRNSASSANPCGAAPGSTNPSGLSFASPGIVSGGIATLLTVAVIPGSGPASTGITVRGNLTAVGGSASQSFFNDGTNGDVTVGDSVYSFRTTIPTGTSEGQKLIPITIADAQGRTGTSSISVTVVPASPAAVASAVIFPHVADGGGYKTTLLLTNASDLGTTATVSFFSTLGTPLSVSVGGTPGSTFTVSVPARGAAKVQTGGLPLGVVTGWARVTASPAAALNGNAIFQLFNGSTLFAEASVPAAPPTRSTDLFVDEDDGFNTGLALANPGPTTAIGKITLRDRAGVTQGTYDFSLPAGSQVAQFVFQIFPAAKTGRAEIAVISGSISATALRLHSSGIFSTVSVGGTPALTALFSPLGGVRSRIVAEINAAASSIDIAMYAFASADLREALVAARGRGLTIRIIADSSQASAQGSEIPTLEGLGFNVKRVSGLGAGTMHDTYMVIDGSTLLTGSYAWSLAAEENNFENAIFVRGSAVVQSYAADFESIWKR